MNRILLFFCLLFGVYSCHTPSTTKTPPANIVSEFRITSTQVGAIRKGMTIKELYAALPEDRIKKLKTRTELSNETPTITISMAIVPVYSSLSIPNGKTTNARVFPESS